MFICHSCFSSLQESSDKTRLNHPVQSLLQELNRARSNIHSLIHSFWKSIPLPIEKRAFRLSNMSESSFRDGWADLMGSEHITKEKVLDHYAQNAENYDEHLRQIQSTGPTRIAEKLAQQVPLEERSHFDILDVAAGTGRVGEALVEKQFGTIDALDPSQPLLAKLEAKGIYRRVFCTFLGNGHNAPVEDGAYDGVVISGGFSKEHLPIEVLDEIIRILKPGGFFVNGMTASYIKFPELLGLEPKMDQLEQAKKWVKISREVQSGSTIHAAGLYHVYKKL